MADTDEPTPKPGEPMVEPEAKTLTPEPEPATMTGRISFTIDAASGEMVMVEAVDAAGVRRELTAEEKDAFAKAEAKESLEDILEKTFEAGITAVLGEDGDEDEVESEEGANLRHLILRPMIAKSAARRFMKREILNRAILGALVRDMAAISAPGAEAAAARRNNPTSSSRRPTSPPGGARH